MSISYDFSEKVCVITGGANGIGRCMAEKFAESGAKIAFADKDREGGEKLQQQLEQRGTPCLFVWGDVGEKDFLQQFSNQIQESFGVVDILIHNACLSRRGILSGCEYEEFNYVLRVGVEAPYYLTKLLLPCLAQGASVINIASTRAFQSQQDTESYSAAKGGIAALTHALSVSLAGRARVNSISPGWIDTGAYHKNEYVPQFSKADLEQHPCRRVGIPEDIAQAAMYLSSGAASFVTGINLTVDGGMTHQMVYDGDFGWFYAPKPEELP